MVTWPVSVFTATRRFETLASSRLHRSKDVLRVDLESLPGAVLAEHLFADPTQERRRNCDAHSSITATGNLHCDFLILLKHHSLPFSPSGITGRQTPIGRFQASRFHLQSDARRQLPRRKVLRRSDAPTAPGSNPPGCQWCLHAGRRACPPTTPRWSVLSSCSFQVTTRRCRFVFVAAIRFAPFDDFRQFGLPCNHHYRPAGGAFRPYSWRTRPPRHRIG